MIGALGEILGALTEIVAAPDEMIGALDEMIGARILGALQSRAQVKLHRLKQ